MNLRQHCSLWIGYVNNRASAQLRPILFVTLYLLCFHIFLFNLPLESPSGLVIGSISILLGLALFLEAINLCVMPLAEITAFQLKETLPLFIMLTMAMILGSIATMAEPALAVFQVTEKAFSANTVSFVSALIRDHIWAIAIAIAAGVGLATLMGSLCTVKHWPLKLVLSVLIGIALILSVIAMLNSETNNIVSLSWDAGGVATGPITVSFMIAFGLGLNRGGNQNFSGMGIVGIASVAPVVLMLMTGLYIFYYGDPLKDIFTQMNNTNASGNIFSHVNMMIAAQKPLMKGLLTALQSCVPIIASLALIILIFVRKMPEGTDEKVLGFIFLFLGSFLFMDGINRGLLPLGESIGSNITRLILPGEDSASERTLIPNFDPNLLYEGVDKEGKPFKFFYLREGSHKVKVIPFSAQHYDEQTQTYSYIPDLALSSSLQNPHSPLGYVIILIFSFFLGAALTAVEPTLITFAKTLEENSAGAINARGMVRLVSWGAGVGLALGILRLLFKFPFPPLIIGVYIVLFILTMISHNDFVEIAWDAAGCTTGSITIPLAIALQIGVNKSVLGMDAFGVIALTNAFAAITMLTYGLYTRRQENKKLNEGYVHD